MIDERTAWVALASVELIGETLFGALITEFGSAAGSLAAVSDGRLQAWMTKRRKLDGRPPLNSPALANLRATAADPGVVFDEIASRGLWTLTPLDIDYPQRLRDLDPPPATINGRGNRDALRANLAVAVVGTRTPTIAGRALTARIATRLVECGAVVVSGLAIGIDGAAHAAALQAGGITVGVIGGGHDSPGPRAHRKLRDEVVAKGGAIISEYRPTTHARHGTFPRRNRIIAALAQATIVVEAPIHSGALITATDAAQLERPVLVAPGRVGDWATAGSLALLRESPARPLVGLDEMVDDLGLLNTDPAPNDEPLRATRDQLLATLGTTERAIASRLLQGPAPLDALIADTDLPPAVVSGAVTLLLMRGWAQSVGPAYMIAGALAR
jgi:DNA processing protein